MKRRVGSSGVWLLVGALALLPLVSCGSDDDTPLFSDMTAGSAGTSGGSSGNGGSASAGGTSAGRGGSSGSSAGGTSGTSSGEAGTTADGGTNNAGGSSSGTSGTGGEGGTSGGGVGGHGGTSNGNGGTDNSGGAPEGGHGGDGQAGAGAEAGMGGEAGDTGADGHELFVGPNGNDLNPGTRAEPFANVTKAHALANPGTTIWILPGTYSVNTRVVLNKSGTAGDAIKLYASAGARPVFDFSGQPRGNAAMRGIELRGHFWHVRGIELANAADNGILISGSDNVIENVRVHDCDDTGVQIMAPEAEATNDAFAAGNLIINCDSFQNFDELTGGENADGFGATLRIGPGNVFRGCRAWNNADDGFDFFAADDIVAVEDSWSFLNGKLPNSTATPGDGNGFKLGGVPAGAGQGDAPHIVDGSASFENRTCGYNKNGNIEDPDINQSFANANSPDCCGGASCADVSAMSMTGAQAKAAPRNPDGSLPPIN